MATCRYLLTSTVLMKILIKSAIKPFTIKSRARLRRLLQGYTLTMQYWLR